MRKCLIMAISFLGSLQFHKIGRAAVHQPHSFFNSAVSLAFPDQQIGNSARIIETTAHKPGRDDGHRLAVEPRPRSNEVLMPAASLFAPLHRLIPVAVFSSEVPVTGCVRKESVKVRRPKSPPSADDSPVDLAALHVFPQRARTEAQYVCRVAQGEQAISNRRRRVGSGWPITLRDIEPYYESS